MVRSAAPPRVSRKVHAEIVLLLGWGSAMLLQFAHPLVAVGVAEHSGFRTDGFARWRRLRRTVDAMLSLTYGTEEDTRRVARGLNALHNQVRGHLSEPAGRVPAGTSYSARDPALLRWVHATSVDVFLRTYEVYVAPLSPEERDRYCAEAAGTEALLGIPEGYLPRSLSALDAYLAEMLASGAITVTDTARALARELLAPSRLRVTRPLFWLAAVPTIGLLPPAIRAHYGFRWSRRHETAFRLSARAVRAALPLVPSPLRHWPAARRPAARGLI
jgi:uncharacterized protein (DUF2236 family)